ncbi:MULTISPECIES: helix-turn-helix transcriptional regulator [unclassified Streptomyces]|uniref:helix-turn-helix domain-containing protein n=1 Tax=unclassified Streptomyces TaxID=2593676 RepID=UPI000F6C761E|nr:MULTISPECIES: helix-turn-helix transcriptional regulator [unclassified Streptomyces]AZM89611.1 XRE family transcriptional regulator [Streptomyces sp. W1SF4]RST01669.1 XRE family transcriptional regulator [Streptomyces sp. WAC07149]
MAVGTEDAGWEVDPEDEQGIAVLAALGRQLKAWREKAGMKAAAFGVEIGYGEDQVRKVEGGKRIPRPEYLDRADEVLRAGGQISAMKEDTEQVRYPKKVRDLAKLEAKAVEIGVYSTHVIHGLLQTPDHARALFEMRQPAYVRDEIETYVSARMARRSVFDRKPAPSLTFVQEEASLRRPIGGTMAWRRQLERLLELSRLRHVSFQVMPADREVHAGMDGGIEVLKFMDGTAVGRSEGAFGGRPVSDPRQLRILELRYGMIRAQALTPLESRDFVEELLGET